MSEPVVIEGIVRADGTLELQDKVPLPAGRVTVTVQPRSNAGKEEDVLEFIRQIQTLRESRGVLANSDAALAAAQKVRDEFDEQVEDAGRLQDECRRLRQEADAKEPK